MPIYEYRCDSCGNELDALQKISDEPLSDCPKCGKGALRRLISAPSFRLKGSGWYETDFKSSEERKRNIADSSDAKQGDGGKSEAADGAASKTKESSKSDSKDAGTKKAADGAGKSSSGKGSDSAVA